MSVSILKELEIKCKQRDEALALLVKVFNHLNGLKLPEKVDSELTLWKQEHARILNRIDAV